MGNGGHVCENELENSCASGIGETVSVSICPEGKARAGFRKRVCTQRRNKVPVRWSRGSDYSPSVMINRETKMAERVGRIYSRTMGGL